MKTTIKFAAAALTLAFALPGAGAAVTADEAAKLHTTLTPLGAEKAGNKEGSIPAWDGVYTKVQPGFKPGDFRVDPFASEKPALAITGKNVDQYAAKLSAATVALLKKYPTYRLDVFPTHRTGGAPSWVYDNTFKNATRAKSIDGGFGVEGAYGGIPFPIPKTGYEAIMNHRLAWTGETIQLPIRTIIVTPDGKRAMATEAEQTLMRPYYFKEGSLEKFDGITQYGRLITRAPASKAGEGILAYDGIDEAHPRAIWQYLVGQRRVRRAPSVSYDTPDSVTSGIGLFDEAFMLFGPIDHHELKLIGKKEMYIPYNNNRAGAAKIADLVGPQFLNPDLVRWELHRVWEVEANLIPGKRHVVAKRRYYLDEDTWQIVMIDGYDAQGQIWRGNYTLTLLAPDLPAVLGNIMWGTYNVQTGAYLLNEASNDMSSQVKAIPRLPSSYFGPEELANQGSR
ncbi:DUF1329 domain-containing protein [Undibacterium sp. RuTC16W]|uniref:DUF1329 domain-containing protein n=1 Tax=Undibacterium sp. RuTC16W TaxID=3413048 RepID=UPI003BF4125B